MVYALIHSLLVFLLFICSLAQNNGTISIGSSLTAGDKVNISWLSPSGDFAFGFKQLQYDDQFLLSIWYDKIPDKTVVWYANVSSQMPRGSGVLRGSRVEIIAESGIQLHDPKGELLWYSIGIFSDVSYGFLNDNGNFVLVGASNSTPLWESFKNPTDTLLPSQELEFDVMLTSRRSETNFSQGRFYLHMNEGGNLIMETKTAPSNIYSDDEYYNSGTSNAENKLVFDESGQIYILSKNGEKFEFKSDSKSLLPVSDYYHRVTLGFDGVFSQHYFPRRSSANNRTWTSIWSQPKNICQNLTGEKGSGACGYNSICSIGNDQKPICECPIGYSLLDLNDPYGSCKPNFTQSCDISGEDLYDLVTLDHTEWPTSDYEQLKPSSEAECMNSCLSDCFCAVSFYRDNNSCWKKKLPMSNGRFNAALPGKMFLKYMKNAPPPQGSRPKKGAPLFDQDPQGWRAKNDRSTLILVVSVLLGSSVFINVLLTLVVCVGFFLIYKKKIINYLPGNNSLEINLRCFTFRELVEATNGFKEELGRGAFGIVYKGVIESSSRTIVAVKKLDRMAGETEKEFRTEVNVIGQTHQKNLVRLVGFCDEGLNRLLVYEYMSNGTLASFLFGDTKPSWSQRIKIALGIARGLAYLHEECSTQIIHCDIKPQNILLDDYYTPRISDFGLAKLLMLNQSRTNTGVRGTKGYVAPEWFRNTQINGKVDVYSFGVVLLEIITCRKSLEGSEIEGGEGAILTDWAWDCFEEGRFDNLVGDDEEAMNDLKKLERFAMVGMWCIQEDPHSRPTMKKVSQMLEGVVEVTKPTSPYSASNMSY